MPDAVAFEIIEIKSNSFDDYRSVRYRARLLEHPNAVARTMAVVSQAARRGVWGAPMLESPFEAAGTPEQVGALLEAISRAAGVWNEWNADTGKPTVKES